jgi:hypothetical protein
LTPELALDVGGGATEDGARHQRPAHLLGCSASFLQQLVQASVELGEPLGRRKDGVPLVGVTGRQGERPPGAVAADDDRGSAGARRTGHQRRVAQPVELAVKGDRLVALEKEDHNL